TQWKRANQFFWKTVSFMVPWFVKKYFLSKMDIVIVPSVWLQKKLRLKNSIVIRHGINVRHFKKVPSKHKLRVSYFGHIDPAKGFLEVIHTMKNLEYDVSIYPTRMNDKLRRYIRKCSPHIKVNGLVKDIRKAYNEADVVLLPYRHASGAIATPLVLLEAMACERAVITTDLPHIREICGNSVLYVKPNDVKGMERAVRRLAGDSKLRRELGKRARKRVVDNYDEKAMLKSYDKLYEALSHGISPKRILQTL
ncbi:MAG: glycosyltransferase family 4 protein, partial [Candidatus Nanoarchaeia archaeon]